MLTRLLIVQDDNSATRLLSHLLKAEGFAVRNSYSGHEALRDAAATDLVLIDWAVKEPPAIEICRSLRSSEGTSHLPIMMLTAPNKEYYRVTSLEAGADDYVSEPFSPRELTARIHTVLRRTRPALCQEILAFADLEMDLVRHRVKRGGHTVSLGPTEYRLLRLLLEKPGRVFTRGQLSDLIWGDRTRVQPQTINGLIRRLRRALSLEGAPDPIRTVRETGYALDYDP